MAGESGVEPLMTVSKTVALPLGYTPMDDCSHLISVAHNQLTVNNNITFYLITYIVYHTF